MRSAEERALIEQILSPEWAWDFPATDWEAQIVDELVAMPVYDIKRFPKEELDRLGMTFNACHANVRRIVENNPTAEAVAGWLVDEPDFAVHSVIKVNGHYICVTPSRSGEQTCVFMPDPKITWTPFRTALAPVRNGRLIAGPGVRQYPGFSTARFQLLRRKLEAGMSLADASTLSEREIAELKSHLPTNDVAH